jgi:hypothetical protein
MTPYNKHIGGSFFPGLVKSQSSNEDKILATVGHLVVNSLVTSAIQFSWHKPPYDLLRKTDCGSLLATLINSLSAAFSIFTSCKGFTFYDINDHTINT